MDHSSRFMSFYLCFNILCIGGIPYVVGLGFELEILLSFILVHIIYYVGL